MRLPSWLSQHLAALRVLLVLTVLTGIVYPLAVFAVARVPGVAGHALIGQSFTDKDGNPIAKYFQARPGTPTGPSNLGPENLTLLDQVCARSLAVGRLEGVSGARPYCTPGGKGAVLAVFADHAVSLDEACPATPFIPQYQGVPVRCAQKGGDYSAGVVTPVRGDAPADPAVPADAVTASGSGLDPQISVAYAKLQTPRVARERGTDPATVERLIARYTTQRALGFIGEPAVDVVGLNAALDQRYPVR
jgi:potassium-transporting ATPase KdpC subunit